MDVADFSREDVRQHLSDLGYTNITEEKLNAFIKDLRKLIRYEERKKVVGETLEMMVPRQNLSSRSDPSLSRRSKEPDSSTSQEEIKKPRRRVRRKDRTKPTEVDRELIAKADVDSVDFEAFGSSQSETHSLYIDVDLPAPSPTESLSTPALAASLLDKPPKSGTGFIRARSGQSLGKPPASSDPVSLHQQYRKHWAKVNIPGEKSHSKLRWAVRGWMMGEEPL